MKYYLPILLFIISCSNILYNHNDSMSMLTSKQMVIEKFGEPTFLTTKDDFDEYYYDFGILENVLIILILKFLWFLKVIQFIL